MLKDKINQYITELQANNQGALGIFKEERDYAVKNQLLADGKLIERDSSFRFADAYIERCDKESENMIRNETVSFLEQPIVYLKKHKNEFVYIESKWFDFIQVEAVSLESDDVFGTYDVMLGLKLQKKFDKKLRDYLHQNLIHDNATYDLMFNGDEGLWSLNFALNDVNGFNENMSIGEGYGLIYQFLFRLMESMETV